MRLQVSRDREIRRSVIEGRKITKKKMIKTLMKIRNTTPATKIVIKMTKTQMYHEERGKEGKIAPRIQSLNLTLKRVLLQILLPLILLGVHLILNKIMAHQVIKMLIIHTKMLSKYR